MKFKLPFLSLLIILIVYQAQGQDFKNKLTLNLGPGHIARQDLVFSPFIHKDFTPVTIGINYRRKSKFYQSLDIRFASFKPMLASPYEYLLNGERNIATQHNFTLVDIDYCIGKVSSNKEKTTTTIGAILANDVQLLDYMYGRIGSFGYYSTTGLGGFVLQEFQLNKKSQVSARIAVPLITWLSRSPYLVNDDEFIENISSHSTVKTFFAFIGDGELATLYSLQTLDAEVKYAYRFSKKGEIGATYLFEFIHSKNPRSLFSYRNSIFCSTSFIF